MAGLRWLAAVVTVVVSATAGRGLAQASRPDGGSAGSPAAAVAVVDFVQLAKNLGVDAKTDRLMREAATAVGAKRIKELAPDAARGRELEKDFRDAVRRVAATQPGADRETAMKDSGVRRLAGELDATAARMDAVEARYREMLRSYALRLEQAWQEAIVPAMAAVCRQRGVQVILAKANVAYCVEQADLTGPLTEYLKSHPLGEFALPPGEWDRP